MGTLSERLRTSAATDWTPRDVIIAAADRIDALEAERQPDGHVRIDGKVYEVRGSLDFERSLPDPRLIGASIWHLVAVPTPHQLYLRCRHQTTPKPGTESQKKDDECAGSTARVRQWPTATSRSGSRTRAGRCRRF